MKNFLLALSLVLMLKVYWKGSCEDSAFARCDKSGILLGVATAGGVAGLVVRNTDGTISFIRREEILKSEWVDVK